MPAESNSYSKLLRSEIIAEHEKKECCRKSLLDGILFVRGDLSERSVKLEITNDELIGFLPKIVHSVYGISPELDFDQRGNAVCSINSEKAKNRLLYLTANDIIRGSEGKCSSCRAAFLKGVFLACGRFTDPNKSFQLEFSCRDKQSTLSNLLNYLGFECRFTVRRGEKIIYIKKSVTIEDILTYLGAQNILFELINIKIKNEFLNNANRIANCEASNINKAVNAAAIQIEAIRYLKEHNLLSSLPQEIIDTAELRYANPDMSISQLCLAADCKISKSGMNHRLAKIVDAYKRALEKSHKE